MHLKKLEVQKETKRTIRHKFHQNNMQCNKHVERILANHFELKNH